jgi:hypothetical protein
MARETSPNKAMQEPLAAPRSTFDDFHTSPAVTLALAIGR